MNIAEKPDNISVIKGSNTIKGEITLPSLAMVIVVLWGNNEEKSHVTSRQIPLFLV